MPGQVLCPPGQVEDYDPATGQWMGTCVDDTYAYQHGPTYKPAPAPQVTPEGYYNAGSLGSVNVSAGPSSDNTILLIAGAVLLFFAMRGGRR